MDQFQVEYHQCLVHKEQFEARGGSECSNSCPDSLASLLVEMFKASYFESERELISTVNFLVTDGHVE